MKQQHTELSSQDNSGCAAHVYREPARGRQQRELVPEILHDVVTIRPQTDHYADGTEETANLVLVHGRVLVTRRELTGSTLGLRCRFRDFRYSKSQR